MTNSSLIIYLLVVGLVFLTIAVIGKARLGFADIDPGCFGRLLALIIGLFSLLWAGLLVLFPNEIITVIKTFLEQQLQQNFGLIISG